jgi:hypothetical protein
MPVPARRVDTATSGRATVVIAEPNAVWNPDGGRHPVLILDVADVVPQLDLSWPPAPPTPPSADGADR